MRVAICDDNQQDIERIRRYTLRMIDYAVEYAFYTRPEELLRECADAEQKPDMYILDIEMPGMDGLAVAKQIRETDPKALLVFLTSYTKYMPSVFEVVTFDFIPKPISEERLRVLFEKAGTYLNLTNQSFSFCYRRVRYSLKFDEILYLEKRGRQAIISASAHPSRPPASRPQEPWPILGIRRSPKKWARPSAAKRTILT